MIKRIEKLIFWKFEKKIQTLFYLIHILDRFLIKYQSFKTLSENYQVVTNLQHPHFSFRPR